MTRNAETREGPKFSLTPGQREHLRLAGLSEIVGDDRTFWSSVAFGIRQGFAHRKAVKQVRAWRAHHGFDGLPEPTVPVEDALASASSLQPMPDPYEEAKRRKAIDNDGDAP